MYTTYEIGNEALKGKAGVAAVRNAIKREPGCATEILIAGMTETLETKDPAEAVQEALKMLRIMAFQLDSRTSKR